MTPGPSDDRGTDHEHPVLLDELWAADEPEALSEGGTHLLDLVAAVDFLARGIRPGFTVWDALEEALRWWLTTDTRPADDEEWQPGDPDPLSTQLAQLVERLHDDPATTAAEILQQAIRRWASIDAQHFNAGYHWPHPAPRREFPPPAITD